MHKPDWTVESTSPQPDKPRSGSAPQGLSQSPNFATQQAWCLRTLEDEGLELAPATLLCLPQRMLAADVATFGSMLTAEWPKFSWKI